MWKVLTWKSTLKESPDTRIYTDIGYIQNRKANLYLEKKESGGSSLDGTKNDEEASWKKRSTSQIRRRHQSIIFILLTSPRALNFGRAHADPVLTTLPPAPPWATRISIGQSFALQASLQQVLAWNSWLRIWSKKHSHGNERERKRPPMKRSTKTNWLTSDWWVQT